jgi:peptide/nickel transport system permease protein
VLRYLTRRLFLLLPALLILSILVFALLRLIPGDPAEVMLGEHATAGQISQFRASRGLDQPIPIQYLRYLASLVRGDWGRSILTNRPVTAELTQRFPATIELALFAMVIACAAGVPIGVLSAYRRHSTVDRLASVVTLAGVALPLFWVGLLFSNTFGSALGWLPPSGRLSIGTELRVITGFYVLDSVITTNPRALADVLRHLVLPALTLSIVPLALIARITRACTLEALSQDHVRTARAKGLSEKTVVLRHALRTAAPPVITAIGLQLGVLFSGAVLTETIFSWPGVGQLVVERVLNRDYPAVQGVVLAVALLFIGINLVADIGAALLDPRMRHA